MSKTTTLLTAVLEVAKPGLLPPFLLVLFTSLASPSAAQGALGYSAPVDEGQDVLDGVVGSARVRAQSPEEKARIMRIIPDLVRALPNTTLKVTYPGNHKVDMGNDLEPSDVVDAPHVELNGKRGHFYSLCLLDADAPSAAKPRHRAWLHWLVVNIPPRKVHAGKVLAAYSPPTPATSTGSHRLVFIQFEQRYEFKQGNFTFIPIRAAFRVPAFMDDNHIQQIVAFNFFRVDTEYTSVL